MKPLYFDILLLIIALWRIITVTYKGFVAEIFSIAAFFISAIVAFTHTADFAIFLLRKFSFLPNILAGPLAFVILFAICYIVIKLIQVVVGGLFTGDIMSGLDRMLGLILGILEAFWILEIIIVIIHIIGQKNASIYNVFPVHKSIVVSILSNLTGLNFRNLHELSRSFRELYQSL